MGLKWVNINTTTTTITANNTKKRKTSKDTSALTAAGHTKNDNKTGNVAMQITKKGSKDAENKTTWSDLEP